MALITEIPDLDSPVDLLRANTAELLAELARLLPDAEQADVTQIGQILCKRLALEAKEWDWLGPAPPRRALEVASDVALAVQVISRLGASANAFNLVCVVSSYMNPKVPWSDAELAAEACKLYGLVDGNTLFEFANWLRPSLLAGVTLTTVASLKNRFAKAKGLRPALGFKSSSAVEESQRSEWKHSTRVAALSSIYLLFKARDYMSVCTSFILNVLDDLDPLFRAQGCFLLLAFVDSNPEYLVASGLLPVFLESVETCFSYLPQLTAPDVSLHLLRDGAYPILVRLLQMDTLQSYVKYLSVLDKNLMGLASHVLARKNDGPTNAVVAFLFDAMASLIANQAKTSVLACMSRLNFMLNQVITDSFLVEFDNGPLVVNLALKVQQAILLVFEDSDAEGQRLLLNYKLDFICAWAILGRRVARYKVGSAETSRLLQRNLTSVLSLDVSSQDVWRQITTAAPELEHLLSC